MTTGILLLLLAVTVANALPACDPGQWRYDDTVLIDQNNGQEYVKCYQVANKAVHWTDGNDECRYGMGFGIPEVRMAEPRTVYQRQAIGWGLVQTNAPTVWIGLTDAQNEGQWRYASDNALVDPAILNGGWLARWAQQQPDDWTAIDPNGEDCMVLNDDSESTGNDVTCDTRVNPQYATWYMYRPLCEFRYYLQSQG